MNRDRLYSLYSPVLILYLLIVGVYLMLILGPLYYKPPWVLDHLTYTLMAATDNLEHFKFWRDYGHVAERLTVLLPIRLLSPVFEGPAVASTAVIVTVYVSILLVGMLWSHRRGGPVAGVLAGCFLVCIIRDMKTRATEVLADPFAALFILAALITAVEATGKSRRVQQALVFFTGFFLWLAMGAKMHYGFYFGLFGLFYLWKRQWENLLYMIGGFTAGAFIFIVLVIALYPKQIWSHYPHMAISVLHHYISGGLNVKAGPQGYGSWVMAWFKLLFTWSFFPVPFYLFALFKKSYESIATRSIFMIGLSFFVLIFILASFSNFPANWMYSFPVLIYLPIGVALVVGRQLEFDNKNSSKKIFSLCALITIIYFTALLAGIFIKTDVEHTKMGGAAIALTFIIACIIISWMMSFNGGRKAAMAFIFFVGVSQAYLLTAHDYPIHKVWKKGYDAHYNILNRVDVNYLRESPILTYFESFPIHAHRAEREKMYVVPILATKVFPCAYIQSVIGNEDALRKFLANRNVKKFKVIITDNAQVVTKYAPGFTIEKEVPGSAKLPNIYHLRPR